MMNEREKYLYHLIVKHSFHRAFDAVKCETTLRLFSSRIRQLQAIAGIASESVTGSPLAEASVDRLISELGSLETELEEMADAWKALSEAIFRSVSDSMKDSQ